MRLRVEDVRWNVGREIWGERKNFGGRTFVYAISTWHAQKKIPRFANLSNYAYVDRI